MTASTHSFNYNRRNSQPQATPYVIPQKHHPSEPIPQYPHHQLHSQYSPTMIHQTSHLSPNGYSKSMQHDQQQQQQHDQQQQQQQQHYTQQQYTQQQYVYPYLPPSQSQSQYQYHDQNQNQNQNLNIISPAIPQKFSQSQPSQQYTQMSLHQQEHQQEQQQEQRPDPSYLSSDKHNSDRDSAIYSPPLSSHPMPKLSREFVVRRISEGESGRVKEELRCEACGKGYKHISSLAKHLWEHTPEWNVTKKLLISKHQQVQLLEAASILVGMNDKSAPVSPVSAAAAAASASASVSAAPSRFSTTNGKKYTHKRAVSDQFTTSATNSFVPLSSTNKEKSNKNTRISKAGNHLQLSTPTPPTSEESVGGNYLSKLKGDGTLYQLKSNRSNSASQCPPSSLKVAPLSPNLNGNGARLDNRVKLGLGDGMHVEQALLSPTGTEELDGVSHAKTTKYEEPINVKFHAVEGSMKQVNKHKN